MSPRARARNPYSRNAEQMKRILPATVMGFSIFAVTSAFAADGYVTGNVNLRAGPDSSYPSVAMLGAGTPVAIQGCVDGWSWCDVAAGDNRGWVAGNFLQEEYQGRRVLVPSYAVQIGIPVVTFVFGTYWDNHYRSRSWYGERDRWSHVRPHYQPVAAHGGSHGNLHPNSSGYSQNAAHGNSHASYAPHHGPGDESKQSRAVAHSSSQARPVRETTKPATHNAAAPRTSVTKAAPANRPQHSNTEHKTVTAAGPARKQAPKSEPKKEGDKDKDQR